MKETCKRSGNASKGKKGTKVGANINAMKNTTIIAICQTP